MARLPPAGPPSTTTPSSSLLSRTCSFRLKNKNSSGSRSGGLTPRRGPVPAAQSPGGRSSAAGGGGGGSASALNGGVELLRATAEPGVWLRPSGEAATPQRSVDASAVHAEPVEAQATPVKAEPVVHVDAARADGRRVHIPADDVQVELELEVPLPGAAVSPGVTVSRARDLRI